MNFSRIKAASRAFSIHLAISIVISALAAVLVFAVWYPFPYRDLAGGQQLFWITVSVSIVCGPLLTLMLFNPSKSWRELTLDLSLITLLQMAALAYGLYNISLARPVVQAFEVDRFVVVPAVDVDTMSLQYAPAQWRKLPWTGPYLVSTRPPQNSDEKLHSIELSIQGLEPSARPDWWQPYGESIEQIQRRMKPLSDLHANRPAAEKMKIDLAIKKTQIPLENLYYLPLTSRKNLDGWIAILNKSAKIVGYAPISGFEN